MIENERTESASQSDGQLTEGKAMPSVADCQEISSNEEKRRFTSFVAAFRVSTEHDGSVSLIAPTMDGKSVSIVVHGSEIGDLENIVRLPIQDIANPGVALVTRRSLLRLVKATRAVLGTNWRNDGLVNSIAPDLEQALEPFAMFNEE